MQIRVSPNSLQCSAEEWQARIDLAAAHRLAFRHGFSEGIFNHLTLTVPGRSDVYYQIPFGMHWSRSDRLVADGGRHSRRQGQARHR